MKSSFDYLVLGGGSGGIASARRAASYGAKVALVLEVCLAAPLYNVRLPFYPVPLFFFAEVWRWCKGAFLRS